MINDYSGTKQAEYPTKDRPNSKPGNSDYEVMEAYPNEIQAKREQYRRRIYDAMLTQGTGGMAPSYVITLLTQWTPGQTIRVAFNGGDDELYAKIEEAASEWCVHGNIKLQFKDPATGAYYRWSRSDTSYRGDIRISFDRTGYYSVIGSESNASSVVGPGEESMNLEGFDAFLPPDWAATVKHEFGHALGFEHEHQHPTDGCNAEFRWDDDPGYVPTKDSDDCWYIVDTAGRRPGIYTVLGGCPNGWPSTKVDFNLRQLPDSRAYMVGPFDKHSIMKYHFASWMFKTGTASPCFSAKNLVLSGQDKAGIAEVYPFPPQAIANRIRAQVRAANTLIEHFPSGSVMRRSLDQLVQHPAAVNYGDLPVKSPSRKPGLRYMVQDLARGGATGIVPRYHQDLFAPQAAPMMDLSQASGIVFNVVDGGHEGLPSLPWQLFKGHSPDVWFFAPSQGRLALRPDGTPALMLTAKVRNNPDGSRTWVGGTLSFLIQVAQELPSAEVVASWHDLIRAQGILPRGNSFQFQPLPLTLGRLNAYGLEDKVQPGGQPLRDVPIGSSSAIAFALNLTGDAAETYYKQFVGRNPIPPSVAIVCSFKYQKKLPSCQIRMWGSKKKTYDYFSDSLKARASYWGLVNASFERSRVRADLKNVGGFQLEVIGTPPPGIDIAKLTDALTDKFLLQEAGPWIKPDPTPADASSPGGFFGGVSYSMKTVNISAEETFSGEIVVSDLIMEPHDISFNFESAFASLDPAKHSALIEDDRKLDMKVVIGNCPLVQQSTSVASYTREGQPVRVQVPDLTGSGGITSGIIQWSAGLEARPTSAQMETAFIFNSPYPSYLVKRTIPISDSGAVIAYFPDNFVQRTDVLFIFEGTSADNLALCQWKWTPPPGSPSLPVSRVVRVVADANPLNLASTQILYPLREEDVVGGGKLELKVKGIRGEWAGKETPAMTLHLGQGSIAVDWSGPFDL